MSKREDKPKVLDFATVSTMLLGRPLAVDGAFLRAMQSAKTEPAAFFDMFSAMGPSAETAEPGIRVIKVRGSLYRGMFYDDYQDIRDLLDEAVADTNALGIVLDIDSPGGDVSGLMDLSEHVLAARGDKPIWAFANDQMASAAYILGAAADKVVSSATGMVGSVGVIAVHLDRSDAEAEAGFKFTEIASGTKKTDTSPHKPLSNSGRATLRAIVDQGMDQFVDFLGRARGLDESTVRGFQGAVFTAEEAVENGLADSIATLDEVVANMFATVQEQPASTVTGTVDGVETRAESSSALEVVEVSDPKTKEGSEPTTDPKAEVVQIDEARADGYKAARGESAVRAKEISKLCLMAGCPDKATEYIISEKTVAEIGDAILETQAATSDNEPGTQSAHSHNGGGDEFVEPVIDVDAIYITRAKQQANLLARNAG